MKLFHLSRAYLPVAFTLVLFSCSKEPLRNLTADEGQLYITSHDSTANFSSYTTFFVADSVAIIDNNQYAGRDRQQFDASIISAVSAQMVARGFTAVARDGNPDIGITISRVYNDQVNVVDYGNYWNSYGGYWDPNYWGYGGYDYYYPGSIGVYQTTEGAVTVDMFDLKNANANSEINYLWNGLIRGSGSFNSAKAQMQADALFAQSQYLKKN